MKATTLEIMKCKNCKAGKRCPPEGGIHLCLTHLVSVDPIVCKCGMRGEPSGPGYTFRGPAS